MRSLGLGLGLGPSRLWSPKNLANLSAWYDASQLAAGAITSLADKSGAGNTLAGTATVAASQQNGMPGVQFNGTSNVLQAAFTLGFPCTFFLAFKMARPGSTLHDIVFDGENAATLTACLANDNTPEYYIYAGLPVPGALVAGDMAVNGAVATCQFNSASSQLWVGTTSKGTGNSGESRGNPNGVTLGARSDGGRPAALTMFEFVACNGANNAADILAAQLYLKAKWGL